MLNSLVAVVPVPHKICKGECKAPKPLSEFYTDSRSTDNCYVICKSCHKKLTHPGPKVQAGYERLDLRWKRAIGNVRLSLACKWCFGVGVDKGAPCSCSTRAIWAKMLNSYHKSRAEAGSKCGGVSSHHGKHGMVYSRKAEEFCADFEMMLKRVSARLDECCEFKEHHRIWRWFYVDHLPGTAILRKLNRPACDVHRLIFKALRRIEVQAVREAVTLQPYALFPLEDYLHLSKDKQGTEYTVHQQEAETSDLW